MKWLPLLLLVACTEAKKPDLRGTYDCYGKTCGSGQICVTLESGSQCDVNEDAGIGQYSLVRWECEDLPAACDGVPSCDCVSYGGKCFGTAGSGREVSFGCI